MTGIDKIKAIHKSAFLAQTEYIPLAVHVLNPQAKKISKYDTVMNPDKALEFFYESMKYTLEVDSDRIPAILCFYQELIIPGMFGGEIFEAEGLNNELNNPMMKPFLEDIDETDRFDERSIDLNSRLMRQAVEHFIHLRKNAPEGVEVLAPTVTSPLDYAVGMRGADFYTDLVLEPEKSMRFLLLIADAIIKVVDAFKAISGEPKDAYISCKGHYFPGFRLACDSMINLSPSMIREFMFPVFETLGKAYGKLLIHYCTTPADTTHVLPVLFECPYISGVDNWQGYRTFFNSREDHLLQQRLAICTDIPADRLEYELIQPFFKDVKRKGGRGILVSTNVSSIDDGRAVYEKWRKHFGE